jgi:hypothetical protein
MNDSQTRILTARKTSLGDGMDIRRAIPQSRLPRVGAWCFLDHFGPIELTGSNPGMRVGPHPHIGLQTVTWLLQGELLHRDDLGYTQLIRPGQLNLMTAGKGVTHSEETPQEHDPSLHGLQFWIALPDSERERDAGFEHHPELPSFERDGLRITLFAGQSAEPDFVTPSPATLFSPLVGKDIELTAPGTHHLALDETFEHAVMLIEGDAIVAGNQLETDTLLFLPRGHDTLEFHNTRTSRLILLGGAPFEEEIIMWWNFVARRHEEIETARANWEAGRHFATETGYAGPRIPAPAITARLKPR